MIQLRSDCLVFKTSTGEAIPCSATQITVEIIGEAAARLDAELIEHAAAAVLHYFKNELGRTFVSVGEFTVALEHVLKGFGLVVMPAGQSESPARITESDLRRLACESGKGYELVFFQRLRDELQDKLRQSPRLLHFRGLRGCVKQLVGARRWSARCQRLNDQIVEYLRHSLKAQNDAPQCALMVQ